MLGCLTLFLFEHSYEGRNLYKIMIKAFTIFGKLNFIKLSAIELFNDAILDFSPRKLSSLELTYPRCGAKHPAWSSYDSYSHYLISYEKGTPVTYDIDITRISTLTVKYFLHFSINKDYPYSLLFTLMNNYIIAAWRIASDHLSILASIEIILLI